MRWQGTGVAPGLALALVLAAGLPRGAAAQETGARAGLLGNQLRVLDGRAAEQYRGSARLKPPVAEVPRQIRPPGYAGAYRGAFLAPARAAARRHGVPEGLFLRLVETESGWDPQAASPRGALGLAQLMPGTARELGIDPADPAQNLDGGARYLRRMHARFGSWRLALAAYNAGPGSVETHGGVPPFPETQGYVARVLGGVAGP